MGSKDAITLLGNIRDNLNEPLSSTEILVSNMGSTFTNSYLLECLNKAKDELWGIIKGVREDYFQISDVFSITSATKEYALASNFSNLEGMKCTTGGYESLRFRRVDQGTREFQDRDALPAGSATNFGELIYTIIAQSKIKFADFPPAALTINYDYVKILADYTLSASSTSDIEDQHRAYLETCATYKALLKNPGDLRLKEYAAEMARLESKVIKSVRIRNQRESQHVAPFTI